MSAQSDAAFSTVAEVVEGQLCTSCGACAGACPTEAIDLSENAYGVMVPDIDPDRCTRCGLCVRVCPGHAFDWPAFRDAIEGGPVENDAIGPCLEAWSGITRDPEILERAQSGGFVSTLLIHALETERIDGAVVTRLRPDAPFHAETFIARTREEVLSAVGSIYLPIPADQIIGTLLKTPGRYAFVGTGCQIEGMRKAEAALPKLGERIALYVGLHCLGVFTRHFIPHALRHFGLRETDVSRLRFKEKPASGWLCDMRMVDRAGGVHDRDGGPSRSWPRPFYTNWRCRLCMDKLNEFSDVSCGDCRIESACEAGPDRPAQDPARGMSDILVRTERGREFVQAAAQASLLALRRSDLRAVAETTQVAAKKIGFLDFAPVARKAGLGVPHNGVVFEPADPGDRDRYESQREGSARAARFYWRVYRLMRLAPVRWALRRLPPRRLRRLNKRHEKHLNHVRMSRAKIRTRRTG